MSASPIDPTDYDDPVECWNCGGEGVTHCCLEEFACVDPEDGCDECVRRCDICRGEGCWPLDAAA